MALARAARGEGIALLHMGCAAYTDAWGFWMTPSTVLWHMALKVPNRIVEAEQWARGRHCDLPIVGVTCSPQPWVSCTGARWRRCYARYNTTACSDRMHSLIGAKGHPAYRPQCHWDQFNV